MLAVSTALSFIVSFAMVRVLLSRFGVPSRSTSRTSARCTSRRCRAPAASRCSPARRARSAFDAARSSGCRWRSPWRSPRSRSMTTCAACLRRMRFAAHFAAAALLVWYVLSPMHPLEMLLLVAGGGVDHQPLQLHGRRRRPGRRHGAHRVSAPTPSRAWLAGEAALATLCAAHRRGGARLPDPQLPSGAHLSRRRRLDSARLSRRRARHRRLARRRLAAVVPGAGVRAVHRRRHASRSLRRLARRERVWRAHREHYYQRMVRMGLGHRSAALIGYAVMCACAACGAASGARRRPACRRTAFAAGSALLGGLALWVDVRWSRHRARRRHELAPPARLRARRPRRGARVGARPSGCASTSTSRRNSSTSMLASLPWVDRASTPPSSGLGLYRGLWRFASLPDLQRIVLAVGIGALAVPALFALVQAAASWCRARLPPHAGAARRHDGRQPLRLSRLEGGPARLDRRQAARRRRCWCSAPARRGARSAQGARGEPALARRRPARRRPAQARRRARRREGARADRRSVGEIAERLGVRQAIIAMPGAPHSVRRRAVELCAARGIAVMTVPALSDIVSGKVSVSALRTVELDDLLGRDPVELDDAGLHALPRRPTVLVTGAGGSIGSELCRQIARFAPARARALRASPSSRCTRSSRNSAIAHPRCRSSPCIGDVKDARRVREVFARYRPRWCSTPRPTSTCR